MARHHVIVFARQPKLGKVKTRLAATLGDTKALEIYHYLLTKTKKSMAHYGSINHVFLTEYDTDYTFWNDVAHKVYVQSEGDLGNKMWSAWQTVYKRFSPEPIVIIGTDCPDLDHNMISIAFEKLENTDVVIGPTYDGGYYLIGMKEPYEWLFNNMPWSTDKVFSDTISRLQKHEKSYACLPLLLDIDHESDWIEWESSQQ